MGRSGTKSPVPPAAKVPAHGVLLETHMIDWAGARIAAGGRKDALLGRVEALRLSFDGCSVDARVRGNRPLPYQVTVRVAQELPESHCTCSRTEPRPCRHAVAALETLRFPLSRPGARPGRSRVGAGRGRIIQAAQAVPGFVILGGKERTMTRDERVAEARAEEIAACLQRARRERARVREDAAEGGPPRYEVTARGGSPVHHVTLRGANRERFACTCEAFAAAELGTCKHVERVRNWRRRQKKSSRRSVPDDLLSLWWRPRAWIERVPDALAEIRVDLPAGAGKGELARYFGGDGWLVPPPDGRNPAAWSRAAREAARRLARRRGWRFDFDPAVTLRQCAAAASERLATRLRAGSKDAHVWDEVVRDLGFRMHAYQETGARFLAGRGRAFLADDMGLGKTLQAIVAALLIRRTAGARRALVVCPASLKHQWSAEIEKACGERAVIVDGPRPGRFEAYRRWRSGFLILNYELVLRDLEAIRRARAELVVLDEAQRIKNWDTKTAKAVKQLDSPYAFILTGTPLENRLLELHSLVEFLHSRAAGPRWRLGPFHAVTEARGRVIAYEGLDVLRGRLRGILLRRERTDVQDQLPERTDNTFWTVMTPEQQLPYRKHAAAAAALLSEQRPLGPGEVGRLLRALTAMRILCNAHAQYAWQEAQQLLRRPPPSEPGDLHPLHAPKLEEFTRVLEDLLDESERKVVVFSQWKRMLRLAHFAVRAGLEARDLRAEVFHGGLTGRARSEMLEAFHCDPEFRVMFSTDAGGLGLNLQEAASVVVNLEVPWNPAVLEQRVGRVHRIGQRRSVQVLHFVTRDAIEERVRHVLESKRALFDGLLVDGADEVVLDERARASFLDRARTLIDDADN